MMMTELRFSSQLAQLRINAISLVRMAAQDPDMKIVRTIFDEISKAAIEKLSLSTSEQRVDSTHIVSNICIRGRADLLNKTIAYFLKMILI